MKASIWFLSIALAASLYMNHLLATRVAVLQNVLQLLIPQ